MPKRSAFRHRRLPWRPSPVLPFSSSSSSSTSSTSSSTSFSTSSSVSPVRSKNLNSATIDMDPYEQEIIDGIKKTLNDVNKRLEGKSKAEQQRIIHDERDNLLAIVQEILAKRVPIVGPLLAWCTTKIASFFGYDPFQWLHFAQYDNNAKMADKASSDPELFNALIKAGEIFEKKKSRYLNKKTEHFRADVTTVSQANELASLIINYCKVLPVLNGQPVLLDENDVKIMLAATIKLILNSATAKQRVRETFSSPIYKPGAYGWVKYKFSSDYDIESSCCSEKKFVELDVEALNYCFPSEAAFRQALRETE